jgi:hypothetical protein
MDREIRAYWKRLGEKPSPGFRRIIEEWWVMENMPLLEFRDGVSGRRAGVRSGPDVWEVELVAREYDHNAERVEEHFGGVVSKEAIEQAFGYVEKFAETIETQIRENERIEQLLGGRED